MSSTTTPIFFWAPSHPTHGFLSQWYPAPFTSPSDSAQTFRDTEQYMMYHKAVLFNDDASAAQIMQATTPAQCKALGRGVKGFEKGRWERERERIVEEGNWGKFTGSGKEEEEGEGLGRRLLGTGERELVETSPHDRIWGVGYGAEEAEANRRDWGENLLGKALMRVRERMKAREKEV